MDRYGGLTYKEEWSPHPSPLPQGEREEEKLLGEFVEGVEGGDFVAFGHGGVIEDGAHEVIQPAAQAQDGLADVYQLRGAQADGMHTQQLAIFTMEQQFEESAVVAHDVSSRDFPIAGHPDFIGHFLLGEVLLISRLPWKFPARRKIPMGKCDVMGFASNPKA